MRMERCKMAKQFFKTSNEMNRLNSADGREVKNAQLATDYKCVFCEKKYIA